MLSALLRDFSRSPEVTTVTLIHKGFEHIPPGEVSWLRSTAEEESQLKELAHSTDATIVIAPETDQILDIRCRWVEESGGWLLGPSQEARRLAGSKTLLGQSWAAVGIPTPPLLGVGEAIQAVREFPFVLKPDDGAGSQTTFLVRNFADSERALTCVNADKLIAQRYVPGTAASVGMLIGPNFVVPLPPGIQQLSRDDRFQYHGGTLPLAEPLRSRATALAARAVQSCPSLLGFNGVDLVLGEADDGSGDFAIEINPRLTTSYIGLRVLTPDNLALAMLRVALGQDMGCLSWHDETVRFHADGAIIP